MEFLKNQWGPMPVWAWGLVAVGVYLFWQRASGAGGIFGSPVSQKSSGNAPHSKHVGKTIKQNHNNLRQVEGF